MYVYIYYYYYYNRCTAQPSDNSNIKYVKTTTRNWWEKEHGWARVASGAQFLEGGG